MIRELLHSCSNPNVARAALLSIGGPFADAVAREARRARSTPGEFAAAAVRDFAEAASDGERAELGSRLARSERPMLAGFRHILERAVPADGPDAALIAACCEAAHAAARGLGR